MASLLDPLDFQASAMAMVRAMDMGLVLRPVSTFRCQHCGRPRKGMSNYRTGLMTNNNTHNRAVFSRGGPYRRSCEPSSESVLHHFVTLRSHESSASQSRLSPFP